MKLLFWLERELNDIVYAVLMRRGKHLVLGGFNLGMKSAKTTIPRGEVVSAERVGDVENVERDHVPQREHNPNMGIPLSILLRKRRG